MRKYGSSGTSYHNITITYYLFHYYEFLADQDLKETMPQKTAKLTRTPNKMYSFPGVIIVQVCMPTKRLFALIMVFGGTDAPITPDQ